MNRDPRYVLSQEAKQSLLDQLRALTADNPISSPTSLKARPISLNASIVYDETLVDGAEAVLDKLQARKRTAETRIELKRRLTQPRERPGDSVNEKT
jgi:hypothetical protein